MNYSEKRVHPRAYAFIPVTIHPEGGPAINGEIENISLGGAAVRCAHSFGGGENVKIELRFAGLKSTLGKIIEVEEIQDRVIIKAEEMAQIRWHNEVSFGIKFVDLSTQTRRFLGRLVEYFQKIQSDAPIFEE